MHHPSIRLLKSYHVQNLYLITIIFVVCRQSATDLLTCPSFTYVANRAVIFAHKFFFVRAELRSSGLLVGLQYYAVAIDPSHPRLVILDVHLAQLTSFQLGLLADGEHFLMKNHITECFPQFIKYSVLPSLFTLSSRPIPFYDFALFVILSLFTAGSAVLGELSVKTEGYREDNK